MSLLMDVRDYLRRYGSATQGELAQQFRTTPEMVDMMAETLRAKGRVRFGRVMPSGGCGCGGCSCAASGQGKKASVRVYEWIEPVNKGP